MKCISPLNLFIDERGRMDVPCGVCHNCLKSKRNDWSFRLEQEQKASRSSYFLTLTYTDENLTWGSIAPTLVKTDLQKFFKRIRKHQQKFKSWKIRYYAVGEYGTKTKRPHYHAMIFNARKETISKLNDLWNLGQTHIAECNPATIRYLTKYVINNIDKNPDGIQPQFSLMSRKPGIGQNYLDKAGKYHLENATLSVINALGTNQKLPRFYQDKIFTPGQKATIKWELQKIAEAKQKEQIDQYAKKGDNFFKLEVDSTEAQIHNINKKLNKKNTF